jgi:hypothetical protein
MPPKSTSKDKPAVPVAAAEDSDEEEVDIEGLQKWIVEQKLVKLEDIGTYNTEYQRAISAADVNSKAAGFKKSGTWDRANSAMIIEMLDTTRARWAKEAREVTTSAKKPEECLSYRHPYGGLACFQERIHKGPIYGAVNGAHRTAALSMMLDKHARDKTYALPSGINKKMKIWAIILKPETPVDILRDFVDRANIVAIKGRENTALDDMQVLLQQKVSMREELFKSGSTAEKLKAKTSTYWKAQLSSKLQARKMQETKKEAQSRKAKAISKLNKTYGYETVWNKAFKIFELLGGCENDPASEGAQLLHLVNLQAQDHITNLAALRADAIECNDKDDKTSIILTATNDDDFRTKLEEWTSVGDFFPFPSNKCGLTIQHNLIDKETTTVEFVRMVERAYAQWLLCFGETLTIGHWQQISPAYKRMTESANEQADEEKGVDEKELNKSYSVCAEAIDFIEAMGEDAADKVTGDQLRVCQLRASLGDFQHLRHFVDKYHTLHPNAETTKQMTTIPGATSALQEAHDATQKKKPNEEGDKTEVVEDEEESSDSTESDDDPKKGDGGSGTKGVQRRSTRKRKESDKVMPDGQRQSRKRKKTKKKDKNKDKAGDKAAKKAKKANNKQKPATGVEEKTTEEKEEKEAEDPEVAKQKAAKMEISRMFILSKPGKVPDFEDKTEAKEYTPDVILRTWIPNHTSQALHEAKLELREISNKMGAFGANNKVDNWEDKACRIIITSHFGARMLTLAQNILRTGDDSLVKLSQLPYFTLSLSKKASGNEDICIWTDNPSVQNLKKVKDYFKESHSVDYMYEQFIHQRRGSMCQVLKDLDDWEENDFNEHFFRPDIYLALFIIKRIIPKPNAVVWDLSPCPGPKFYQMLGMPYDSQASCWFGAVYSLNSVCNMENGGRYAALTVGTGGAYMATAKQGVTQPALEQCFIMQNIVQYLLEHHGIFVASFFQNEDELDIRGKQDAARTIINIALAASPSVTRDNFADFTHWMYYQHKSDHTVNAAFFDTTLTAGDSKIDGAGKGLFAKSIIKDGATIGYFSGMWIDKGTWRKKQLGFKVAGGEKGNYEFSLQDFPTIWNRHLTYV